MLSEEGTQQGDPEAPPLFAEAIQTLAKKLESKINVWYLDDGNLAYDPKVACHGAEYPKNKFVPG